MKSKIFNPVMALMMAFSVVGFSAEWQLDKSHSEVGFRVKHMVIATVNGSFNEFEGTVNFDPDNLNDSKIEGTVKVASVDTKNEKRDEHVRGDDFFDAEKYPDITFVSSEIKKDGDGFVAIGDLTIRDVTKKVEIPFTLAGPITDPWGGTRVAIDAGTTINRQDFNVKWNTAMDNGGVVVSDNVVLSLHAELIQK